MHCLEWQAFALITLIALANWAVFPFGSQKFLDILCGNLITGSTHLSHFATKFLSPARNYFREENKINAF